MSAVWRIARRLLMAVGAYTVAAFCAVAYAMRRDDRISRTSP